MHKLCLPANPHETFLDQLISAEPDREFQEKRRRFLSVTVASGYPSVTAAMRKCLRFFLIGVPGFRAVLRPGEAGLVMRGRSLDDSGGRSRWFGAGGGRILREPTQELV